MSNKSCDGLFKRLYDNTILNTMIRHFSKFKCIIGFTGIVFMCSCTPASRMTTNKKSEIINWQAESENIINLSVLLEDEGVEGSPALLNNNNLLFESKKNENYDLWSIDPEKRSGMVQITNYEGTDRLPCVHPDGKRFIFLSDRSQTGYYLGELGKPTVISLVEVSQPYVGLYTRGDVSPDGNTFIYPSGKYIWTYDLNTKTKTQYVQGTEPRWSPDGAKIIFRKIAKEIFPGRFTTSIWMMNSDGTEQTEVINGDYNFSYSGACISPDGEKILYLKTRVLKGYDEVEFLNPDIWICNIDGSNHIQITTNPLSDQEAIWVDNQTIVFCSDRPQSGNSSDRKWDIWKGKINF